MLFPRRRSRWSAANSIRCAHWGRPPGGRGSRWRYEQERAIWEENMRMRGLDSDEDEWNAEGFDQQSFVSDQFHFDSINTARWRSGRKYATDSNSDSSESNSGDSNDGGTETQMVL